MKFLKIPAWANGCKNLPLQIFHTLSFRKEGIYWVLKSLGGLSGSWPELTAASYCDWLSISDGDLKLSNRDMFDFFKGISDLDEIYIVGFSGEKIVAELELVDSTFWIISFDPDFVDIMS